LSNFADHSVVIKTDMSKFGADAVDCVGYRGTSHGVTHYNLTLKRSWISMSHRHFLSFVDSSKQLFCTGSSFLESIEPLNSCLKEKAVFEWKEQLLQGFSLLKKEFVCTHLLAHFDPQLKTIVTTDASAVAIGVFLSQ
jgi:hypothetical protein